MPRQSAGILLYRLDAGEPQVFLAHPGGPFWKKKDLGAWSIPKGEIADGEDPLAAARREFAEETGVAVGGAARALGAIVQKAGKRVRAWAVEGDLDVAAIESNLCEIEWPRGSGKTISFPEVDRAGWFALDEARRRILPAQAPFLDRLLEALVGG